MKKVLWMLLAVAMVLSAKNALADAVAASQQQDSRFIDGIDMIFMGYANKIVEHKNIIDFRLNNGSTGLNVTGGNGLNEWGGAVDGKHEDLGVIGVYVNRPWLAPQFNGEPANWTATGGVLLTGTWSGNGVNPVGSFFNGNNSASSPAERTAMGNVLTPRNKVDLFWGKDSGNSNLGVHLNYADNTPIQNNNTVTDSQSPAVVLTDTSRSSMAFGGDLGLGFKSDSGPFNDLNIHGGFSLGSFNNIPVSQTAPTGTAKSNDSVKDNGIYTITLGALGVNSIDKDTNLNVYLDGAMNNFATKTSFKTDGDGSGSYTDNAADSDYENTTSYNEIVVALGFGCSHKVNDGAAMFTSGLNAGFLTGNSKATEQNSVGTAAAVVTDLNTDELDFSQLNLAWRASVDTKVASWLNVRAGISKSLFNTSNYKLIGNRTAAGPLQGTTATSQFTGDVAGQTGTTATAFSTGFGIHWQNWVLNTTVTAASLESSLSYPAPGNGILFDNGNWFSVAEADLGYAF